MNRLYRVFLLQNIYCCWFWGTFAGSSVKVDWARRPAGVSLQVCKIKFASSFLHVPQHLVLDYFFLTSGFIREEFYSVSISIWVWWRHILNSCICVKCQCLLIASLSWGHSEASRHCIFICYYDLISSDLWKSHQAGYDFFFNMRG